MPHRGIPGPASSDWTGAPQARLDSPSQLGHSPRARSAARETVRGPIWYAPRASMYGPVPTRESLLSRARERKPAWLKVPLPGGDGHARLKALARSLDLHTVCEEARCPNVGECWSGARPTMTLMVLGDECTRRCRFCAVKTADRPRPPDPDEPRHVGAAVAAMKVGYVVVTSVDRDDLSDGGAAHYAACVREVRAQSPAT